MVSLTASCIWERNVLKTTVRLGKDFKSSSLMTLMNSPLAIKQEHMEFAAVSREELWVDQRFQTI